MKNFILYSFLAIQILPLTSKADEAITLPVITVPSGLTEGTQTTLTNNQIAELLPWAKESNDFLADLISGLQGLSNADKLDHLVEGIKQIVGESAPKNSELLMRYVLNRGLVINGILSSEMDPTEVGSLDVKLRVLISSIKMALEYYEIDVNALTGKKPASFADFGIDYFNFLTELNKSIFDATATYAVEKISLEWLQWDLYRDMNNTSYAHKITKINNTIKALPKTKLSDAQSLSYVRKLKILIEQLDINKKQETKKTQNFSNTKFEALIAKKKLVTSIDDGISIANEAMKYIETPEDFFQAISPGIDSPNDNYKSQLKQVAFNHRKLLINIPQTKAEDILKLAKILDNVDNIITTKMNYLTKVKSAEQFITLFSYEFSSPSNNYITALKKLAMDNYELFLSLNPTADQKSYLIVQLR